MDAYTDLRVADPTPSPEAMANEPLWVQMQRNSWHGVDFPYHSALDLVSFRRDYLRTLSSVDDSLGRILAWIDAQDADRETIVVFTSDNGFLFGEHGLIDKRNAYEDSIRIPLIVWSTQRIRGGRIEDRLVSTLDIAPTLRSLAGATVPPDATGRDLTSLLLSDTVVDWPDQPLIYEYYWEFNYPQTPSLFAIRNDRYKLIRHHGVWDTDALYDLQADPGEMENLIDDPALLAVRLQLSQALHEHLGQQGASHAIPYTYKYNQGAVFRNSQVTDPPLVFPQRWQRPPGADDRYEHFLPDSPNKAQRLKILNRVLEKTRDP
jgi:arylsulfatase A-like enzyme